MNKRSIFGLGYFTNIRIEHALCESQEIGRLLEHPATWSFAQDVSLLFHFIASDKKKPRDLNHLIKKRKNGTTNWARIKAIEDEVKHSKKDHNVHYNTHRNEPSCF